MAANKGHAISVENLEVVRVTGRRIVLQGTCGEKFNILVDDWPKLRTRLNRAARIARKQELSRSEMQMKQMMEMSRQMQMQPSNEKWINRHATFFEKG